MADQRPSPSPLQPPTDPNTSAYRPQSSSSRRKSRPGPLRHGHSSSTSIDSTTFVDHRHQPMSLSRNMSVSQTHAVRRSRRPRVLRPDGQYSSDETSDRDEEQEEEDEETARLMSQSVHRQSFAPWTKPRPMTADETSRLMGSSERLDSYGARGQSPTRTGRRASLYGPRYHHVNHPNSVPSSIGSPPPHLRQRTLSLVGTGADGEVVSMPLAQRAQRRLTQPS